MITDDVSPYGDDEYSRLYMPPEGAVQFHLQRSLKGAEDSGFWVMSMGFLPLANWYEILPDCKCKRWFRVIQCTDPEKEKIRNKVEYMYVCECFGEVIE